VGLLMLWLDDPVKALVNLLVMVMLKVLGQDISQLLFRGEDEIVEALFLDGSDKSLCVRIEAGISCRQFHGFDASSFWDTLKFRCNSTLLQ